MSAKVEAWRDLVNTVLQDEGSPLPPALVLAIIEAESSGTPSAYRGEAAINDGSIGLMQVLYNTARANGYNGAPGDKNTLSGLFDPQTNITFGVRFLAGLVSELGSYPNAVSAYNGGVRNGLNGKPNYGFGGPVLGDEPVTLCLERDANKKCVRTFTAQPGQYGNQPYVDKVMAAVDAYGGLGDSGDGGDGTGTSEAGFTTVGVVVALALAAAATAVFKR